MGHVFVIEGMADVRETIAMVLESAGYDIVSVWGAEEALARMGRQRPELVLAGVRLPDMRLEPFVAQLREIDGLAPLVILGHSEFDRPIALAHGADFLCIPCEAADLLTVVSRTVVANR